MHIILGKGHHYPSIDAGSRKSSDKISENFQDYQSLQPTKSSNKNIHHVTNDRDVQPTQAFVGRVGMLTTVDPPSCLHNPISYNVTLTYGLRSGHFKDQGRVDSFDICFRQCCQDDECNLVFLLRNYCYLVSCYDRESCALKPLVSRANRELAIAFVYKEHSLKSMEWNRASTNRMSSLPVSYQTNKQINIQPNLLTQNSNDLSELKVESDPDIGLTYHEANSGNPFLQYTYPIRNEVYGNPTDSAENVMSKEFSNPNSNVSPQTKSRLGNFGDPGSTFHYPGSSLSCTPGPVKYFATLYNGLNLGYFEEVGIVNDMEACQAYCCRKSACDVAFMQQERCYLITCPSLEFCRDVPASNVLGNTRLSHMFRQRRFSGSVGDVDVYKEGRWHNNGDTYSHEDTSEGVRGFNNNNNAYENPGNFNNFGGMSKSMSDAYRRPDTHESRNFQGTEGINFIRDKFEGDGKDRIGSKIERKDDIPIGYEDKKLHFEPPHDSNDNTNDAGMKLLGDAVADIKERKHLGNEKRSYGMRSNSEIPTPPVSDFENLLNKDRKDPLIFDDSGGKREHSSRENSLADMASDILSNIMKHRAHDSVESIWSNDKDPLQNEISKAKESSTAGEFVKELQTSKNRKIAEELEHKRITGDPTDQRKLPDDNIGIYGDSSLNNDLARQDTVSDSRKSLADESKLIETLYNLVKENSKTKNDDLAQRKANSNKQEMHLKKNDPGYEIGDTTYPEDRTEAKSDEYVDHVDGNGDQSSPDGTYSKKIGSKLRHRKKVRPRLRLTNDDYGNEGYGKIFDTGNENEVVDAKDIAQSGRKEGKMNGNLDGSQSGQQLDENEESHQKFNGGKILENQRNMGQQKELQTVNDYGNDDEINDDTSWNYDYNDPVDFDDDLGVEQKPNNFQAANERKLHVSSTSPNNLWLNYGQANLAGIPVKGHERNSPIFDGKPMVFVNEKQPLAQQNDDVVLSELEKIEDELADIKGKPKSLSDVAENKAHNSEKDISAHEILRPVGTKNSHEANTMMAGGNKQKPDNNVKESIVDILAELKDVRLPELDAKNFKDHISHKNSSVQTGKKDFNKVILRELNEIENQIGNMSKSSGRLEETNVSQKGKDFHQTKISPKKKLVPKVDDIGDEISELLDEDWDVGKRSDIPRPGVVDGMSREALRSGFYGNSPTNGMGRMETGMSDKGKRSALQYH